MFPISLMLFQKGGGMSGLDGRALERKVNPFPTPTTIWWCLYSPQSSFTFTIEDRFTSPVQIPTNSPLSHGGHIVPGDQKGFVLPR